MSSPARMGMPTRQYRCHKRQKPCDQCRERKLKCQVTGGSGQSPCQRCARNSVPCTFIGLPRRRTVSTAALHEISLDGSRVGDASIVLPNEPDASTVSHMQSAAETSVHDSLTASAPIEYRDGTRHAAMAQASDSMGVTASGATALNTPSSSSYHTSSRVSTQLSQTMDNIDGHSILLLGASSESDPWLLRHCHFDQLGLRSVHKMYFRNAGGCPTSDKIPVHFIVSDNKYLNHPLMPLYTGIGHDARLQLNQLVLPSYGARLINLFRKHVYPTLPIVPASYLDIAVTANTTSPALDNADTALDSVPVPVLAAMYGLAMPFALNDELLAVVNAFEIPPLQQLWTMVHALIQAEIHCPSLSTVQAAILFLHKDSGQATSENSTANSSGIDLSSSAFLWSFIGCTVGMAHSLGLQFECHMFGIPNADKRLRKRLWWALFIEEKWQSLLMGRPPYIRGVEWDVSELQDGDFEVKGPASSYFEDTDSIGWRLFMPFRDMARLAVIAADVQEHLYSLRACQRLAVDLAQSISTAKPLFDRLNDWRASISTAEPSDTSMDQAATYPMTVYFAYLTLVTYVWRALLRPTVRSSPPPKIIDVEEEPPEAGGFFFEELSWDFSELPEIELHLEDDVTAHGEASSATIKELYQAAQNYGGTVATFTARLTSRHFDEFWYSWSRIGFAVISNFLTVLLVQAPTAENAPRAKWMLESWRQTLRHQSKAFPILRLAMARLNAFYWGGLAETFALPPHVHDVVA